jgi:hypothetical protein
VSNELLIHTSYVQSHCPLCGSAKSMRAADAPRNLYSEKLAALLQTTESDLISHLSNVRCAQCSLVYKLRWLPDACLVQLFQGEVALHPKGWDVVSGRFSLSNLRLEFSKLQAACAAKDRAQIARYQRATRGILDSIIDFPGSALAQQLDALIANAEHEASSFSEISAALSALAPRMQQAAPYKRFSGFADSALWTWLGAHVGAITRYAEVGCPLWGFLPAKCTGSAQKTYLMRAEPNYWGQGCQQNGLHCVQALVQREGAIVQSAWDVLKPDQFDVIGLFQYLDHVAAPRELMQQALRAARAVLMVIDDGALPCAIQHRSAWSEESVSYLANSCGARLHAGFEPIRRSGNQLFLLERTT